MTKALFLVLGWLLLASSSFPQVPASAEPNRITGARLDVEYNQEKTTATIHITNLSDKTIDTVLTSYKTGEGSNVSSMFTANLKTGESITRNETSNHAMVIGLDAIRYVDGTMETRNDAIANAIKEEERIAKEQHQRELAYGKAFAVPDALLHMPVEEQIVRNYYAKLSFISEVGTLSQVMAQVTGGFSSRLTDSAARGLLEDHAHFALSEFQIGDLSEIEDSPWMLLLNPDAPQDMIMVNSSSAAFGLNHHMEQLKTYQVALREHDNREQQDERKNQLAASMRYTGVSTVKDALKRIYTGEWSRYAAFTVHADLHGQAFTYRTIFLFARQGEMVAIFDPTTRVPTSLNEPLYPQVLVESVYREVPFIKTWTAEHQLAGCKKFKEPEVCCNPVTGQCGLATEDVSHSLSLPLDERDLPLLKTFLEPAPPSATATQPNAPCPVTAADIAPSQP
jgi:hypothetical protein